MARLSSETTEEVRRAPRRRVARSAEVSGSVLDGVASSRKAPLRVGISDGGRRSIKKGWYLPAAVLVVGVGGALLVGYSDEGQINVSNVIAERNAKLGTGAEASGSDTGSTDGSVVIPVQNNPSTVPDGGLQGSGGLLPPAPPTPVVEAETASGTTSSFEATTTDSAEEVVDETTEEEVTPPAEETEVSDLEVDPGR